MASSWEPYEQVAREVIAALGEALGIATVEGKQVLSGRSGTDWEVDAKAWLSGSDGFLIVEARRHTTSGVQQEAVAAVAYRIQDVGASGGIIVWPLPLQRGAALVAEAENIAHVRLSAESTTERYLAEFLGRRFIGVSATDSITLSDSASVTVKRAEDQ